MASMIFNRPAFAWLALPHSSAHVTCSPNEPRIKLLNNLATIIPYLTIQGCECSHAEDRKVVSFSINLKSEQFTKHANK
jgi:hypothetical protein